MTEEVRGAITSDKVETDNKHFATVKADQTCEEVLIPRDNAFRQLNWEVTLEKGAVYNPQEEIGIYAQKVECKYGSQIDGDVFGRDQVIIEHGGTAHSEANDTIGTRIVGSVMTEDGQIEIVSPDAVMDERTDDPVIIYGDMVGNHISIEEPTIVYGCIKADKTFRTNAPVVIVGDVRSEGLIEASDLFAFTISAGDDITLGENIIVVNPTLLSDEGDIRIADAVGVLPPSLYDHISEENDIDAVGHWVFDIDSVWTDETLQPIDRTNYEGGTLVSHSWRIVEEPPEERRVRARELLQEMLDRTRRAPPDIEKLRYQGIASLDDLGTTIEGDMVVGTQEKTVEETDITEIDQSTTEVDKSTEVHDESTNVEDSVLNRSDVGDEGTDGGG